MLGMCLFVVFPAVARPKPIRMHSGNNSAPPFCAKTPPDGQIVSEIRQRHGHLTRLDGNLSRSLRNLLTISRARSACSGNCPVVVPNGQRGRRQSILESGRYPQSPCWRLDSLHICTYGEHVRKSDHAKLYQLILSSCSKHRHRGIRAPTKYGLGIDTNTMSIRLLRQTPSRP